MAVASVNQTYVNEHHDDSREGLEESFGSHSIGKERHHEISAHLGWHQ